MIILKFRKMEHEDLLKKVKKMREFTQDLEECLEDAYEDEDYKYRTSYRKEEEDEWDEPKNRYARMRRSK